MKILTKGVFHHFSKFRSFFTRWLKFKRFCAFYSKKNVVVPRCLWEIFHQILMNLWVSLWNTSFWSIIQITILHTRLVSALYINIMHSFCLNVQFSAYYGAFVWFLCFYFHLLSLSLGHLMGRIEGAFCVWFKFFWPK